MPWEPSERNMTLRIRDSPGSSFGSLRRSQKGIKMNRKSITQTNTFLDVFVHQFGTNVEIVLELVGKPKWNQFENQYYGKDEGNGNF